MNAARRRSPVMLPMPKAKRARKAKEPPKPACPMHHLAYFTQKACAAFGRVQKVPYSWLWVNTISRVLRDIREKRHHRHWVAELERQRALPKLWLAAHQRTKDAICTAFRNHAPAMRWFRSNLPLIRERARKEAEAQAKRLVTCICGGSLTSNWDSRENLCRACNLGVLSSSCDCSWTKWEVLQCSSCQGPRRASAPTHSGADRTQEMSHLTFATYRFPLLWARYQYSFKVPHYLPRT